MSISTRHIDDCVYMQQRIAEKGKDGRNSFEDGKIKGMLYWTITVNCSMCCWTTGDQQRSRTYLPAGSCCSSQGEVCLGYET